MREEYIKEYLDLENQKSEIENKQSELKRLIAKYKNGDIVEVNSLSQNYCGKRGKIKSIHTTISNGRVNIYYSLQKVLKDGSIGRQELGMTYLGFPEDFLNLISSK